MNRKKRTIYKESDKLQDEVFKNPSSEYRGAPFWAWNGDLKQDVLFEQIEYFKKMGFGGAHMHIRTGMVQKYLGEEHMSLVQACTEKFKQENMIPWLYDEDRWPSGFAGGYVTKERKNRQKNLRFSMQVLPEDEDRTLLAVYDVQLDVEGYLATYAKIAADSSVVGRKWYAYLEIAKGEPWYNNQAYVDTLDKNAVQAFVDCAYEAYHQAVGEDFGKVIPSIFTDEPQHRKKVLLNKATDETDIFYPWTTELCTYYRERYKIDILEYLPEVFWELQSGKISVARYYLHDCITELFVSAYAKTVGTWCERHNIMLTGHVNYEQSMYHQTTSVGEAMRSYAYFQLPGVDLLCHNFEYATVKQCQSAAHQYERGAMLCELYGVTNWDFDFRGHKNQGDWLAALGVTVRVPHLAYYSMEGEAKRDYPASIFYQSPWYEKYEYLESHYARINTALTRGNPVVRVGVIHPIESYWLHYGANDKTADIRANLESKFENVMQWLLFSTMDFDFISEALLPSLCEKGGNPLQVGSMAYDVVVVPECETLRESTLQRLEAFKAQGGKIVFMGNSPTLCNAVPSQRGKQLYDSSVVIPFNKTALTDVLSEYRDLQIMRADGTASENLVYQMREEANGVKWLFVANGKNCYTKNYPERQDVQLLVKGCYQPTVYDTLTGKISPIAYRCQNGQTEIPYTFYQNDSILLQLSPVQGGALEIETPKREKIPVKVCAKNAYILSEDNVLVLDLAEYKLNDGAWQEEEEILRLDNFCRKALGWGEITGKDVQNWVQPADEIENFVTLRFTVESEIEVLAPKLAVEQLAMADIEWNGAQVEKKSVGYYIDRCLQVVELPVLRKGKNLLEVRCPIGKRVSVENLFLLGNFGVRVLGREKTIVALPNVLHFGDIRGQGLGFYGANVNYVCEIESSASGSLCVHIPDYFGSLIGVKLDGKDCGNIAFAPYNLTIPSVEKGKHTLELCLYGNRFNTLGQIHYNHNNDLRYHPGETLAWYGPGAFRSTGDLWSYEYTTKTMGIMQTPVCWIEK